MHSGTAEEGLHRTQEPRHTSGIPPLIKVHSGPLVGHFFYALGGGLLLGQWTTSINMGMDLYRGGLIRHHMTRKET